MSNDYFLAMCPKCAQKHVLFEQDKGDEVRAERDRANALLAELIACEDERDQIAAERLYGKPHLPDHKARTLDHRQRYNEAWRAAREFDAHLKGKNNA